MLFDVRKQLTFYGAYHNNPTNYLPRPSFIPPIEYKFNDYLEFQFNWATFIWIFYIVYYHILEPVAAFLYVPQFFLSLLTAISVSHRPEALRYVIALHIAAWLAQFVGHGVAEKRAPALLDNIVGALVLAPFFVHVELLFRLGYRPEFQKALHNDIGQEIARIKKAEGDKKRADELDEELKEEQEL
ncbi:unnamed protein product [Somion occarium]|uniref:DUF962-domain-containing protein n=1 Tax=Somion occarium TaxID=3059160 RepID=A0ABP1D155_9APHY